MHGISTETLVVLAVLVFATSVILGLAFSALVLAADGLTTHVIIGVVFVAGVGNLLASFDPIGLGGSVAWRVVIFAAALGAGCIASRAIITGQSASGRSGPLAVVVALGALGFGTASAITFGLLLAIALAAFERVSGY